MLTFLDVTEKRRVEQVRRDFVANASHELKPPLTTIHGFAETLLDDDPPDTLWRDSLASIRNNTLRLQKMVEDLLDLSRLEFGTWSARREQVVVQDVAAESWSDFRTRADNAGVRFVLEGPAGYGRTSRPSTSVPQPDRERTALHRAGRNH